MTEQEILVAAVAGIEASLPPEWKAVLKLSDRDQLIIIIGQIMNLHRRCDNNHDLAITAFNA